MLNKLRSRVALVAVSCLIVGLGAAVAYAENIDPFNNGSQFSYGENVGWFNAEPANCSGCGVQVNATSVTGYMWGENIGWINMSCQNNAACAGPAGNWGVTKAVNGDLSGYAWAENAGWISFSCDNSSSCGFVDYGVSIDQATGVFSGYAWGENVGWISFSDTSPVAYQVQTFDDTDFDGVLSDVDNCPDDANPGQDNADGDAFGDACDNCPAVSTPWEVPPGDGDCDYFTDAEEAVIGTDAGDPCGFIAGGMTPSETWPADLNPTNEINILDILAFKPQFGKDDTDIDWDPRFDIQVNGVIDILDVLKTKPVFNKSCTP
jgi:hypothetical protein